MKQSESLRVYNLLQKEINDLLLGPDEFLTENALAARYQVSKAPVRYAVHRLCEEGKLVSYPRKGYLVVDMNQKEFRDLQQLRLLNEEFAVRQAVQNASDAELEALLAGAGQAQDVESNHRFHLEIARLSGNPYLADLLERLLVTLGRMLSLQNMAPSGPLECYHREIAQAMIRRDPEEAALWVRRDINLGGSDPSCS